MKTRRGRWMAVAALMAGPVMGTVYTWTGSGSDPDVWNEDNNWSPTGLCLSGSCFPHTGNDDAIIDTPPGTDSEVDFDDDRTIDDLLVTGPSSRFIFDGDGTARILTCDSLVIEGPTGDNPGVKVINRAGIHAQDP